MVFKSLKKESDLGLDAVCLGFFGRQLVLEILELLLYCTYNSSKQDW